MRVLFIVLFLFVYHLSVLGQEIRILDKTSLNPVKHAQIDVLGHRTATQFTNSEGLVLLPDTEPNDTLLINHVSYGSHTIPLATVRDNGYIIYLTYSFINHPEIDIFSSRERAISTPQQVTRLDRKDIKLSTPNTAAALLESTGQVMVQRSQLGGGSPILRGFEANKILLVVDGVRLNNAIYRSGHLQNAISIDPNILESTEVIFGATSLTYGSDALGGVIHYRSLTPQFSDTSLVKANVSFRLGTAAQENATHVHFELLNKKISSLTSVTYSDFGDLRMGANRKHGDETWGLVPIYASTDSLGNDVIKINSNPLIQKHTAYNQIDFLQKIRFKLSENSALTANAQYSTTSNIPRFDRYNDYKNGTLKYAVWDYGPQNRLLLSLSADLYLNTKIADKMNTIFAYQKIDEDRFTRKLFSDDLYKRYEDVMVGSFNMDFIKDFGTKKKLHYGVEITYNDVQSSAYIARDGLIASKGSTRYPNGGSHLTTSATYVTFLHHFHEKWQYNIGLRHTAIAAYSNFIEDNQPYDLPFNEITLINDATTYSMGLKFEPNKTTTFRLISSTGFRAPNVDDYGKIFERDGFLVIPNNQLEPEYTFNNEIGFHKEIIDKLQIDANIYQTYYSNVIIQKDFVLNGQDSLVYEGELARLQSNQNETIANLYGYFVGVKYQPIESWEISASANRTIGILHQFTDRQPMPHIPPFFAKGDVSYSKDKWMANFYIFYHDLKSKSSIAEGRTDNAKEGLDGAFPAWYTLNTGVSYQISKGISAQVKLENILDQHYKVFASGLSAPGRNFILSLHANIN